MDNRRVLDFIEKKMEAKRERLLHEMDDEIECLAVQQSQSGIISKDAARKRIREQTEELLKNEASLNHIISGFQLIDNHWKEVLRGEDQERFQADLALAKERSCALRDGRLEWKDLADCGGTLQGLYRMSDFLMNSIQKIGYNLFEKGSYTEAEHVYTLLCALNPFFVDYIYSLAEILHRLNKRDEAIFHLYIAVALNEDNPVSHLRLVALLIEAGEKKRAEEELAAAEECLRKEGSNSPHRDFLQGLKAMISKL